jgi:hypothetical protein
MKERGGVGFQRWVVPAANRTSCQARGATMSGRGPRTVDATQVSPPKGEGLGGIGTGVSWRRHRDLNPRITVLQVVRATSRK